jgi:branched-chain amino acid transport system substrate-binding protein
MFQPLEGVMLIKRTALSLLGLLLTSICQLSSAADPIRIGALYPLSGQVAKSGEDTLNGIRLAVDIINNRFPDVQLPFAATEGLPGLGNAKIELIAADHQGSPEIGGAEAERLIVQRKAVALIGAFHSSVAATSSQIAERLGVPYVSGESEATNLTERGFKYFFRTTPTTRTQVRDFFTFLRDVNKGAANPVRTIAVVNENTLWGKEFAQSVDSYFSEFPEFKLAINITYQQGTPDVASEVQRLIAAKPDVVMHASYDAEAILFARTYKQYNFAPRGVMAIGAAFASGAFRNALGPDANFFLVREHWSRDLGANNPVVTQVAKMYRERFGKDMDGTAARAFTAMMTLAEAINRAGSTDPRKIREALATTNLTSEQLIMPWQGVKFDQKGQNTLTSAVFVQIQNVEPKMVWPADRATAKLVWPRPAWK